MEIDLAGYLYMYTVTKGKPQRRIKVTSQKKKTDETNKWMKSNRLLFIFSKRVCTPMLSFFSLSFMSLWYCTQVTRTSSKECKRNLNYLYIYRYLQDGHYWRRCRDRRIHPYSHSRMKEGVKEWEKMKKKRMRKNKREDLVLRGKVEQRTTSMNIFFFFF